MKIFGPALLGDESLFVAAGISDSVKALFFVRLIEGKLNRIEKNIQTETAVDLQAEQIYDMT